MTIRELIAAECTQKLDIPFNAVRGKRVHFPMHETDYYLSEDGLLVGVNRVTFRFSAQLGDATCSGFADNELTAEQLACLGL